MAARSGVTSIGALTLVSALLVGGMVSPSIAQVRREPTAAPVTLRAQSGAPFVPLVEAPIP